MVEKFKFKEFTIVLAKKSIMQRHGDDAKIYIASNEKYIILPYFFFDGDFNDEGEINTHSFYISHENPTLKQLYRLVYNEIEKRKN